MRSMRPAQPAIRIPLVLPDLPKGRLNSVSAAQIIAHYTPDNVIYAEEANTSGLPLMMQLARGRPMTHLPLTGGSIGQGLPLAIGAAIAAPDRKVVCPSGDGGAAYTLQALWTMARENLDVTVVIYANRSYAILNIELQRVGAAGGGTQGAVDARPAQSRDQLGADRERPRRRGQPRRHRGGIRRSIRFRDGAARPAADRSADLKEAAP